MGGGTSDRPIVGGVRSGHEGLEVLSFHESELLPTPSSEVESKRSSLRGLPDDGVDAKNSPFSSVGVALQLLRRRMERGLLAGTGIGAGDGCRSAGGFSMGEKW